MESRFWEIDAARGLAVCAMIAFHAVFDLNYFKGMGPDASAGLWWWVARATAGAFIFIAGACVSIRFSRLKHLGRGKVVRLFLGRSAKLLAAGLAITAISFVFLSGRGTIWFGVLHFIAVGSILCLPFAGRKWLALAGAAVAIALGIALGNVVVSWPWLLWLGLTPGGFYSFDYFPVFPWLGVMLLGVFAGGALYQPSGRRFEFPDWGGNPAIRCLSFLGRHSLAIYLVHQPLLIALLLGLG